MIWWSFVAIISTSTFLASDDKISVVLVEAFVGKEADEVIAVPTKRLKLDPTISDASSTLLTAGDGTGDVIKHFNFALKCWNFLNSTEAHKKGTSFIYLLYFIIFECGWE